MSQTLSTILCPGCGAETPTTLPACPRCHRLIHSARLNELAQQASAAEARAEISTALAHWREAIELLPPDSTQAATILARINTLSQQLSSGSAPAPAAQQSPGGKGLLAGLGLFAMLLWKFKVVLVFILTKGKLLLLGLTKAKTLLSMFAFFAADLSMHGWLFALGIVGSIYIHEMGHVDALRRYGFKATAPMFVPGLGALIRLKQHPANPAEDARIGLAGPLWGLAAAIICFVIYLATNAPIWASLTYFGALMNIFNLLPVWSLDGSRGFSALSRNQAMIVTAALGGAWFLTSHVMLLIVAIFALIRAATKPHDAPADRGAFALFLILIASLSALLHVRVSV